MTPTTNSGGSGLVVGVPREIKPDEHRVAITPDGVREVGQYGVHVLVEAGAGADSSFPDEAYQRAGAEIVDKAEEVWERSGLICKVKEPQPSEFDWFRPDLTIFTYLHLAAYPTVADALLDHGVTGIAYETVTDAEGALPLLAPMSEVAGRMSVQIGAHYLERHNGGRGVLLGGAPGVRPARVVVLGAGNVGWNAAWMAAGLEAEVDLLDRNVDRLRFIDQIQMGRITTLTSNRGQVERVVAEADLVIGAVLVPRRAGSGRRDRGHDHGHEAGRGRRRHRHRPGRLHRDQPRDQPRRSRVREARRRALRRRQHAGRGALHVDLRADQRHPALPGRAGPARGGRGRPPRPGARARLQHGRRERHQRGGGRGARTAPRGARPRLG